MMVPRLVPGVQLHEANSAFDQSASDQAASSVVASLVVVEPVELLGGLRFLSDIERIAGCGLHSGRKFIALHAGAQIALPRQPRQLSLIQFRDQSQHLRLWRAGQLWRWVKIQNSRFLRPNHCPLINGRQPAILPVLDTQHWKTGRICQHKKAWEPGIA
jgi:hypothetical protein